MYAFNRVNRFGLEYTLTEMSNNQTLVKCKQKPGVLFMFAAGIHVIEQGWYNWAMKGMNIQDAFPTLTADEREFLMTGMTPKDFELMAKSAKEY